MSETTPEAPAAAEPEKKTATTKAAAAKAAKPEPEAEKPCGHCFRFGWPETATSLGCEHGNWDREL